VNSTHRYGKSQTVWHQSFPPTSRADLYPSRRWYLIYGRDARLSWPGWWLHSKTVYPPETVTHLSVMTGTWTDDRQSQVWHPNQCHYITEPLNLAKVNTPYLYTVQCSILPCSRDLRIPPNNKSLHPKQDIDPFSTPQKKKSKVFWRQL